MQLTEDLPRTMHRAVVRALNSAPIAPVDLNPAAAAAKTAIKTPTDTEALTAVLRVIGSMLGPACAQLWTADTDRHGLQLTASWQSPGLPTAPGLTGPPTDGLRRDRDPGVTTASTEVWIGGLGAGRIRAERATWAEAAGLTTAIIVPVPTRGHHGLMKLLTGPGPGPELAFALESIGSHLATFLDSRYTSREAMLRSVLANSQSLIYVKDLEGRYLLMNEPLQRARSVTEADLLGKDDWTLDPVLAPVWRADDLRAQEGEYSVEEWFDGPDGRIYYDTVKFPLRDAAGGTYAVCGISQDVTARRRAAEAMTVARDAALAANAAKTSFLATMSHEIRTPMNAVIGMTDLLLQTTLDAHQREYVETVRTSGDALLALINDILDFSRIDAGEMELEDRPFELRRCIEDTLTLIAPAATHLDLIAHVDAHCPQIVVGDVNRLRQVLVNLVGNAVKFTERGDVLVSVTAAQPAQSGKPTQSSEPAQSSKPTQNSKPAQSALLTEGIDPTEGIAPTEGVLLTFAVRDTGIGIPQDRCGEIFDSFSQVDASTTRVYGGSGLGLAISQAIVRSMGGEITVSSTVGTGSTFQFDLRLRQHTETAAAADAPDDSPSTDLSGRRVLVVDDNDTNRRILRIQLESWGMSCTAVASPRGALAVLESGSEIDLAILDMHMPETDGAELAAQIRALPDCAQLPMVLLTSLATKPLVAEGELFAGFHTKPIRAGTLRTMLAQILAPPEVSMAAPAAESTGTAGPGAPSGALTPTGDSRSEPCTPVTPDAAGSPNAPDPSDAQAADRVGLRVLLVEDNVVNQMVAQRLLHNLGHFVDIAGDGQQALDAVLRRDYDVVLMDIHMPTMDGLDATRAIRARVPAQRQPQIVAMTASSLPEDRRACKAAGMDGYLLKPVRLADLSESLTSLRPTSGTAEPSSSTGAVLPVDLSVLSRLTADMAVTSADGRRLLIEAYLEQADTWIPELTSAARDGDTTRIRMITHTFGSSSSLIGAQPLAESLAELGRAAADRSGDLIGLTAAISVEYRLVSLVLNANRDALAAI